MLPAKRWVIPENDKELNVNIYIPAEIWGLMLVSLLTLGSHAGLYLFDKWFAHRKFSASNEVAGIIFGALSLIYSLIVAFLIVAVWENYGQLYRTIEKETDNLNSVLVHSNLLPDSLQQPVSLALKEYCERVTGEEWDMADVQKPFQGSAIPRLRSLLFAAEKKNMIEGKLLGIMDERLSTITELRSDRLSHTRSYVPQLIWFILIIDSLLVIFFSWFFQMQSAALKRIFLSFLWIIIGLSLFLIYMLDHPFAGSTRVSNAGYQQILKIISETDQN